MSLELRGVEVQHRTRSQRRPGYGEGDTLVFGFHVGPMAISCICNLPEDIEDGGKGEWVNPPLARIKMAFGPEYDWKAFGEQRLQLRATSEGRALIFGFQFPPLAIFCIANLPEKDGEF